MMFSLSVVLDIDECAEDTDQCAQNCRNIVGSYVCSCNAGYSLNMDGRGCDGKTQCVVLGWLKEHHYTLLYAIAMATGGWNNRNCADLPMPCIVCLYIPYKGWVEVF